MMQEREKTSIKQVLDQESIREACLKVRKLLIYIKLNAGTPFSHIPTSLTKNMYEWGSIA